MRYSLDEMSMDKGQYGGGFSAVDYNEGMPRYLRITDINDDGTLNEEIKAPSGTPEEWKKYYLKPGDLLFARSGATVGKAYLYEEAEGAAVYAGYLIKFEINQKIAFPKYVYYYTKSVEYTHWVENKQNVVAQPNINAKQYGRELKIPLPPLPVQRRIAAALDLADRQRQLLRAEIAAYGELGESLFLEMFGDPIFNEKGYPLVELKRVASKIGSGATPRGGRDAYLESGIPLVRSLNIHDNFFKEEKLAFISDEQAAKLNNVIIEKYDVLFNITGASVCRCAIAPDEMIGGRVNQHVAIIRTKKGMVEPHYLVHLLISKGFKCLLLDIASKGGATREAITKTDLRRLAFPLPPFQLQQQYTNRIQKMEALKTQAETALAEADDLFQALLQRGFRGELFGERVADRV